MYDEIPIINEESEGYEIIYKDHADHIIKREFVRKNNMPKIPSKQQLDAKTEFSLLLQDDYRLVVSKIEEDTQENYDKTGEEEIVNIQFEILSLKDGSEPKDVDGETAVGRKVFATLRPNSIGFMKDGTPSKTRQFIAMMTNQDIFEEMDFGDWKDFEGKEINAEIIQYVNSQGKKRNKISRFLPTKK